MTERIERTITVHEWDESFSVPLADFVAQLNGLLETVAQEHRGAVMIEFDRTGNDYDYSQGELCVHYTRPETADEAAESERLAAQNRRWHEDREREELARLSAKYAPAGRGQRVD